LAKGAVLADCDVDAADLALVLPGALVRRERFWSGHEAVIRKDDCVGCGGCLAHCRFSAIKMEGRGAGEATFTVDPLACEGCGACVELCPVKAVDFPERSCGEWFISETAHGPMVHARLAPAAENSGKMVSLVRREARRIAEERRAAWLLVDGPPGIGCPVIASITGAGLILAVTEPTVSGEHDLARVLQLAGHFGIPTAVCVNKWEIHRGMAERIERAAVDAGAFLAGRIPYDPAVTKAQLQGKPVVEAGDGPATRGIKETWEKVCGKNC
jgi:MinD superfamily P-loop ATPase